MSFNEIYVAERTMEQNVQEAHQEAQGQRLKRVAGQERKCRLYHRAAGHVGRRLVAWGQHLEERYSAAAGSPGPRSANRPAG